MRGVLGVVLVALSLPLAARGADRMVLGEYFTMLG